MKAITATITQYEANDGTIHNSEAECTMYEAGLKQATYWVIRHSPDLTEGRGPTRLTCVKVITPYGESDALMWMNDYCYRMYGRPIAFVQGCSACANWVLVKADREQYDRHDMEAEHDRYGTVTVDLLKLDKDGHALQGRPSKS